MKIAVSLWVGICLASTTAAQTPATGQQTPPAAADSAPTPVRMMHFDPGTLIRVELETAIDAKKARIGDQVLATTTDDLNSNPPGLATKGCQVVGHIVEVTPHEGNTPSKLEIAFDKLTLKNDTDMPLPAAIQAVGFAESSQSGPGPVPLSGGAPGGYVGQKMSSPGSNSNTGGAKLPFNSQGVIGMSGVSLSAGSAQDSVLTSNKHTIKLEKGMQMILRTN